MRDIRAMVSTRHSMGADEQLVSLETVTRKSTRSPSPKKRRLDQDTPEQKFVDARATPFEQRKRQGLSSSRLASSQGTTIEDGYETAEDEVTDSVGSSNTLVESPITASNRSSKAVSKDSSKQQPLVVSDMDATDESGSDDEAPEAISNIKGAETAKAIQDAKDLVVRQRAEEVRDKRKRRDEKLREQRKTPKSGAPAEPVEPLIEESAEAEDGEAVNKLSRPSIPRLLPDEVLNAPIAPRGPLMEASEAQPTSSHTRFEPKKELSAMQKGPLFVQVLKGRRKDLAPKKSASVSNTKSQWLYQRGKNITDRRPVRKSLA